jgi:sorbitol/mannitol transport system permease protein
MARAVSNRRKALVTVAAWTVGFLIFFPILWTILTSFKTEGDAIASPPKFLFFDWTLENYHTVQERSNYFLHFMNSVIISVGSTLLALVIAIPAAWSMAFVPGKRTKDVLMWMLSTKMMPAVGVLIPIYMIFRDTGLLDSRLGLTVVLMLINLPIVVWMLYTYFKEIPSEILEAARMDGAPPLKRFWFIMLPHLARAATVVILIQTIFLLSTFAEILVTTNGGPGTASTTLTYLVYVQSLLQFDVGGGAAGGIVAVILANIVAIFLMRMIGKNLES